MFDYINQFYDMYNNSLFLNENKYKELFSNKSPNYNKYNDHIDYIMVMENIVNLILEKYDIISDKTDNLSLNIQICLLLNRYLVVIFTTMCILDDIYYDQLTTVSFKKRRTGKSSSLTISKSSNTTRNFTKYIKNIIEKFNEDIFGEKSSDTLNIDTFRNPDIKKLYNSIEDKEDIENIESLDINKIMNYEYICDYIKYYLIYINYTIFINNDNKFITIPQYHDICWFISIITGITYSDRSKKLLLDNINSRTNGNYQKFNDFIFYIINTITNNYKEYSENIKDDCEILKYLKQQPVYIVKYLVWKYCKNNSLDIFNTIFNTIFNNKQLTTKNNIREVKTNYHESNEIKKIFKLLLNNECKNNFFLKKIIEHKNSKTITDIIDFIDIIYKNKDDDDFVVDDNNIFIDKFNEYLITNHNLYGDDESIIQHINDEEINTGLHYADNAISFFYKILNINTLICNANISTGNLKLTCSSKVQDPNPDVIIMNVDMNDPSTPGTEIKDKSSKLQQITYKENKYILDYIINITCDKETCDNCCHCISAIHYNNNEYFHNSAINTIEDHRCLFEEEEEEEVEEIDVNIPCSLIKQNWSDKVYKDIYYNIYKCKYSEKNPKIELHKENKYIFEITTYNYRSRNVYVYIKKDTPSTSMALSTLSSAPMTLVSPSAPSVPMTTGGSKKINFTYNNKTYKRTLYTSNNKYYIIFNKKKIYINKKNLATF
jgi:hypothetical protein